MIKLVGINTTPIELNLENPPKFYRKVSARPKSDGNYSVEVFKLKNFNKFTQEALYVRQKDQKVKAKDSDFTNFSFSAKPSSTYKHYQTEEES